MKAVLLKSIIPPLLFFIIYMNLNFFVFSFKARQNYLNKRLIKTEKAIEELERELKPLSKDKRNKRHAELSKTLKEIEKLKSDKTEQTRTQVNIYSKFTDNRLTLLSEQTVKSPPDSIKEIQSLTNFTISGDYQDIIQMLKDISASSLIPVGFSLEASADEKSRYTISIWNKHEQL